MHIVRKVSHVLAMVILSLSLSGCILGYVKNYTIDEDGAPSYTVQSIVTIGGCPPDSDFLFGAFSCEFTVEVNSVVYTYLARLGFLGNLGGLTVLLDPVILQVPADITALSGTYSGPANGSLSITIVTGPLQADATRQIVPEPGTKFVIIDFPGGRLPSAGPGDYQFNFGFKAPASVPSPLPLKVILAGKVTVAGQTYYPPLFPCTTDMASVPTLTLPTANSLTPINVTPMLTQQGCNNMTYDLTPSGGSAVGVVEYRNSDFDHYFLTPHSTEITLLDNKTPPFQAWSRTGRIFRAYPNATAPAGSVPVCRLFNSHFGSKSSHFFALQGFGCEATLAQFPDWALEDDKLFKAMLPGASSACAAGTVPLYRLYNQGMGGAPNHRFVTAVSDQQDMVKQGWVAEGVVMCVPF